MSLELNGYVMDFNYYIKIIITESSSEKQTLLTQNKNICVNL